MAKVEGMKSRLQKGASTSNRINQRNWCFPGKWKEKKRRKLYKINQGEFRHISRPKKFIQKKNWLNEKMRERACKK